MRKTIATVAALVALAASAKPSNPLRIMPLGDSITYGSHGQATAGYRGPLYYLLKDAGYTIDYVGTDGGTQGTLPDSDHEHEGHSGWCTANVPGVPRGGLYEYLPNSFSRILAPNIVILFIGTNDAEDEKSMPQIVERYRKILDRIFEMQPSAHVIAGTPLERKQPRQEKLLATHFVPFVKGIAAEYTAAGKPVHFVDMRSRLTLDDLDDGLHPTVAGYEKMAKAWFEEIRRIVPTPDAYEDPKPAVVTFEYDDLDPNRAVFRFNEPLDRAGAESVANYSLTGRAGAAVKKATLSKDGRTLLLEFAGLAPGARYRLKLGALKNAEGTAAMSPAEREIAPADPAAIRRGPAGRVPELKDYRLVYSIELPRSGADYMRKAPEYAVDDSAKAGAFKRVAYYLELRRSGGELEWVWASFDAYTNDVARIGIPAAPVDADFQGYVNNLRYFSSSLGSHERAQGFVEFFKGKYDERNEMKVAGASNGCYDWGDRVTDPKPGYGSMQVHDFEGRTTLFAYNRWRGGDQDLGIGNRPDHGHTDWTSAQNSRDYNVRTLQVYVK